MSLFDRAERIEEIVPENVQDIIRELSGTIINIEEYSSGNKKFASLIERFYNYAKAGFEHATLRTCPVHFRFFEREDELIHTLQLRHFITNLMFWEPLVKLNRYEFIDASYIVDCTKLSHKLNKWYVDNKIILPFRKNINNVDMNKAIHDMFYNLARISRDFNIILGLSINTETFIDMSERVPRFNEILRTRIGEGMQPNEIESILLSLTTEQINIMKDHDNFLRPILRSGTGIKEGQFKEFAVNGGMAPDLDGVTIPIPINSNFIVGGLGTVTNYYIDALKGRKSIIMNKTVMGKSGHFARMVMLITSDVKLDHHVHDCKTQRPIRMVIKSLDHLMRLRGRNYRLREQREYQTLTGSELHLIGKTILLRSPVTCASKQICRKCYGDLYYTNRDIESVGGFAGTEITNPLSQSILSSKHLLNTDSDKIGFGEAFYDLFTLANNEVFLNLENDDINADDYNIVFIRENVVSIDDFEESDFSSYVPLFHIEHKKTGERVEIIEDNGKELYISSELKKIMDRDHSNKETITLDMAKIPDDLRLFAVEVSNNELTKPLYSIMYLLNRIDHEGCETVDEMSQMLLDLLIESKIAADSVHGEIIIRPLIRHGKKVLKRPAFERYGADRDYQILTVESALKKHPSVIISLSFQDLGRQLTNPLTFQKTETSFVDPFFQEKV